MLPLLIGSDNGHALTLFIAQMVSKPLNVTCKFHCTYWPQISGQVESIKKKKVINPIVYKLILETGENRPNFLPRPFLRQDIPWQDPIRLRLSHI